MLIIRLLSFSHKIAGYARSIKPVIPGLARRVNNALLSNSDNFHIPYRFRKSDLLWQANRLASITFKYLCFNPSQSDLQRKLRRCKPLPPFKLACYQIIKQAVGYVNGIYTMIKPLNPSTLIPVLSTDFADFRRLLTNQ